MALTLQQAFSSFMFYVSFYCASCLFFLAFVFLSAFSSFSFFPLHICMCMSSFVVPMLPLSPSSFFCLLSLKAVAAALHGNALTPLPPAGRTDLFVASLHDTAHRRRHGGGEHRRGGSRMVDPFSRSTTGGFPQGSLHLLGTITFSLHLNATAALTTALTRAFAAGGGGGGSTHGFPSAHLQNAPTGGFLLHEGGVFGSRSRGHFFCV